jgi:hypothetical protein
MYVRVLRPQGLMIGNEHFVVHPDKHPQFLPDAAKNSTGFDLLVKHGDLIIVAAEPVVEKPVEPIKKDSPKKEK